MLRETLKSHADKISGFDGEKLLLLVLVTLLSIPCFLVGDEGRVSPDLFFMDCRFPYCLALYRLASLIYSCKEIGQLCATVEFRFVPGAFEERRPKLEELLCLIGDFDTSFL